MQNNRGGLLSWKEFFKPNKTKIIITIVLVILPLILQLFIQGGALAFGFPFPFYKTYIPQSAEGGLIPEPIQEFSFISIIIDIIILYVISILIIFIYSKLEEKNNKLIMQSLFLFFTLFLLFTILSLLFSIGHPLMKIRTAIGLPLAFYAHDPYTGQGIQLNSIFLWEYLLIDITYWYIISILIIWLYKRYKK